MISVVITAGGTSSRFKGENKLLCKIEGKTVIEICVQKFLNIDIIDEIIICANLSIIDELKQLFASFSTVKIIEGGKSRQESVFNGLLECSSPEYVIIHDGARPFISEKTILDCLDNAKKSGASIVAVKTIDTIKIVDENGFIVSTPNRNTLWNAQTPQIFKYDLILGLHEKYKDRDFTDDSLLFEEAGIPVVITVGEYSNFKITTIQDMEKIKNGS